MLYGLTYEEKRAWGEALRRKRLAVRISQANLAEEAGISATAIGQYECYGMGIPVMVALNIVDALDWTMEEWQDDAHQMLIHDAWRDADKWRVSGHKAQTRNKNEKHS